jgi:polysaccharide biosynthesis transport protein
VGRNLSPSIPVDRTQPTERARLPAGAFWSRVLRHRFGVLGLSVACGLSAAWVVRGLPPAYEAEVSLWVDTQGVEQGPARDPGPGAWMAAPDGQEALRSQIALIESRTLAESVTERLGLGEAAALGPGRADWRTWVRDVFPQVESPPPPTQAQARTARVAEVRRRLTAEALPDSRIVRLRFTAGDPVLAARVANAFAEAYVEKGHKAGEQPLQEPAAPAHAGLVEPGEPAEGTRDRHAAGRGAPLLPGDRTPASAGDRLQELATQVSEARGRRDELRQMHDRMQSDGTLSSAELVAHPALARNLSLQSLKASELQADRAVAELAKRYGPLHPRMIAARSEQDAVRAMLATETRQAAAGLAQELDAARGQVDDLEAELRALPAATQPPRGADPAPPAQPVRTDGRPAALRPVRLQDAAPEHGRTWAPAQVIDAALVPWAPVEPDATRIVGAAALVGLAVGLALAMLSAYRDKTLRRPQDIEAALRLPVLGAIPRPGRHWRKRTPLDRLFAAQPGSAFAETFRNLRTRILLSSPDASRAVVLVTSSVRGDGRTTVAINLALALGRLDKALLIDADLRGALAASRLGVPAGAPGLADLVGGSANEDACLHRLEGSALDVLPAGAVPPDPLEVLSSPHLVRTLDRLRDRYPWIVIDSAAALAASDALLLSRVSSAVLLVIRAGETPLPAIQAAVGQLRQVGAPLVGAVLNACHQGAGSPHADASSWARAAGEAPCA